MALCSNRLNQARMALGNPAYYEESSLDTSFAQQIQQRLCGLLNLCLSLSEREPRTHQLGVIPILKVYGQGIQHGGRLSQLANDSAPCGVAVSTLA
jgi:hypothetical protein